MPTELPELTATDITGALTPAQSAALLGRFTEINPHYCGAHAADVLDDLDQADSDLVLLEPFFQDNPGLPAGCGLAARALLWSGTPLTAAGVIDLIARAVLNRT